MKRIVYLGGLGDEADELSPHLRSRHEVGKILAENSGCVVVELRASVVIGSGSLSFEFVRSLVQRLPVMVCPKWVRIPTQPIAIEDLLQYLLAAFNWKGRTSRVFEIGGPDQVSYAEIMREVARQRGLRRVLLPAPVLTPRLSSLWLGLVTPVNARAGRKLVDSLKNPTVVTAPAASVEFPVRPRGLSEAIQRALTHEGQDVAETRWSDALSSSRGSRGWRGVEFGSRVVDAREIRVAKRGLYADTEDRRLERLVFCGLALDGSRLARLALRRHWQTPRATRPGATSGRRGTGLVEGRAVRA